MEQNNHVLGPAEIVFDRLVNQYGLSEDVQVDMITSFFLTGIIDLGLEYLDRHPEELAEFLRFAKDNFLPRS